MPSRAEKYSPQSLGVMVNVSSQRRQARHPAPARAEQAAPGPNLDGPLPWVERDCTPVGSAVERGRCEILIKIYGDGVLTQWPHEKGSGDRIRMSQPLRIPSVPSPVQKGDAEGFWPAEILLAGMGRCRSLAGPDTLRPRVEARHIEPVEGTTFRAP